MDDGAGIHDDPLTRYLTYHDRLRQLLPLMASSPTTSNSPLGLDGDQRGVSPAAQRIPVRARATSPQTTVRAQATMPTHTLPPLTLTNALPAPAQRRTQLVRPQPTRAPPVTPHVTATGYWRVCGFARDSTETLAFQRHTHTHITKPRAQYARVHGTAHQLPWSASLQSMMRDPLHTARACNAVHAATGQHHSSSRSPDHSQPSTKTSTARQLERQPVGRQAALEGGKAPPKRDDPYPQLRT